MIIDNSGFNGWKLRGTPSEITVSNDVHHIVSGSVGNYIDSVISCTPGMVIDIECEARTISGTGGLIGVDTTNDGTFTSFTYLDGYDFTNNDWAPIKIKIIVPMTNTNKYARVCFGIRVGVTAIVEFRKIKIDISKGINENKPQLIACGLITHKANTEPYVHLNFPSFGIDSVAFNGTNTITVTLKTSSVAERRPLMFVSGTSDNFLVPVAGVVIPGDKTTFSIKWTNGTAFQNINALEVYASLKVYI